MYVCNAILPIPITEQMFRAMHLFDFVRAFINGVLVALVAVLFHRLRDNKLSTLGVSSCSLSAQSTRMYAGLVGFIGGAMDVLLIMHAEGILLMTLLVITLLAINLRDFARHIAIMLHPHSVASWGDVFQMLSIYLSMLAGFTLVNATLEGVHVLTKTELPFGFAANHGDIFLNSLYYTVVTMTTLGFGDIVPHTWDGKLLLIVQCLVSYFMFALMVGIITRGVVRPHDVE